MIEIDTSGGSLPFAGVRGRQRCFVGGRARAVGGRSDCRGYGRGGSEVVRGGMDGHRGGGGRHRRPAPGSGRGHGVAGVSALAQQQVQRVADPPDARAVVFGRRGRCRYDRRVGRGRRGRGRRGRRRFGHRRRAARVLLFLVQHVLADLVLDQ